MKITYLIDCYVWCIYQIKINNIKQNKKGENWNELSIS